LLCADPAVGARPCVQSVSPVDLLIESDVEFI